MGKARTLLLPLSLFLALSGPAWACLWYYGKNVKGETVSVGGYEANPKRFIENLTRNPQHAYALGVDTSQEPAPEADFRIRSDFAATLVHQGKAAKAIPILEAIEKAHPNEYTIAVNLGTAYELSGENEKALQWIREGLRRNPASHNGTEWLHVLILEAKIAAAKDPEWAKTHSVLGLDFGTGDVPQMPSRLPAGQVPETIRMALKYQLHERLAFVPPPDPLVAGMIADLGDLEGIQETADHAIALYDLALSYQPVNPDLILKRKAHALKFAGQIIPKSAVKDPRANVVVAIAIVASLGAVILYVIKKLK